MNRLFKYRNINRYRRIIGLLVKYGFDDMVSRGGLNKIIPYRLRLSYRKEGRTLHDLSRFERIRLLLEELGPTFVKLGQILSNRQDIIPEELLKELSRLHDQVKPEENFDTKAHVEQLLDISIEDHFKFIKEQPMASASVAQVHEAELLSGERVAMKILRPGIHDVIRQDISIMKDIARIVSRNVPEIAEIRPMEVVKFFERTINHEINLLQEAANIERFTHYFSKDENIYIPKVYHRYTNSGVLCLEYIDGIKVTDKEQLEFNEIDIQEITRKGTELYFKMVYEYGFFHADPHPGNLLVLRNRKLCFLDFGMMGSILPADQQLLHDLLIYFIRKDVTKIVHVLEKLSKNSLYEHQRELEYEIYDLIQEVSSLPLKELKLYKLLEKFRYIVFEYKIYLPSDFFLLIRTFIVMEGIGTQINPEFNLFKDLRVFVRKLLQKKMHPKSLYKDVEDYLMEIREIVRQAPEDFKTIIDNLKSGNLNIKFEHQGLDGFQKSLHELTNRITLAIITAALVIGSSLVVLSNIPPKLFNIPIIGVVGFLFSLFLGVWTIFAILNRRQ